ncbi:unnamed protein product [Malus baccata var. baccata]
MAKSKEKTRTKPKSKSHLPHAKTLLVQSLFLSDDDAKTKVKAKSNDKFGAKPKSKYRVRSGPVEKPRREVLHIQRPTHEKQKCLLKDVGDSKAQLQIEGRAEQEDRNFGRCRVCRKENEHFSSACPYWNGVPPGAIVGDDSTKTPTVVPTLVVPRMDVLLSHIVTTVGIVVSTGRKTMAKSEAKTRTKPKSSLTSITLKPCSCNLSLSSADARAKVKAKSKYNSGTKPKSKYCVRFGSVEKPRVLRIQRPNGSKEVGDSKAQLQLEEKTEQEKHNFGTVEFAFCGLFYKNPNCCAHPGGSSKGRLIVAYCNHCRDKGLHWSEKCRNVPRTNHINLYSSHPLSRIC